MLDYATFPDQRQELIKESLRVTGRVLVTELASTLNVSEHTIRRDLHELSKDGFCKKVYGGAVITIPEVSDFDVRKSLNISSKSNIAHKCAQLVKPETCIFIDSGTTNLVMAEALPEDLSLTVVTNSPEIATVLLNKPMCEVIILGGQIHKGVNGCIGSTALAQIQGINFDQAFIGGCAMAPESGLTGYDYADCEFKKAVIQQSSENIVALTAEKMPGVARYVVAKSTDIDVIVTEENTVKEYVNAFKGLDIRVHQV